jgi:hypothetical protein
MPKKKSWPSDQLQTKKQLNFTKKKKKKKIRNSLAPRYLRKDYKVITEKLDATEKSMITQCSKQARKKQSQQTTIFTLNQNK